MRLHRLELTALGPFPGTHVVDLDGLGRDGLFLLHGETGAGKSSVLDAIAYALFGVVPGIRNKAHRLRCDRADPGTATAVRLELTLAGRRVRVRRTLDWERPKRRGAGITREPATALLEDSRDGVWVGLSTRIDEVSHQLLDWIGMSAEQFFQVVLLPQGEFAQFLLAESKDRERLLERLFGTERFSNVQRWLADKQADGRIAAEACESEMRAYLHRMCQELGVSREDEPALAAADARWRDERAAVAQRAALDAETALAAADAERVAARTAYDVAAQQARRQGRLRAVLAEHAVLEAGAPAAGAARAELAAARRAAGIAPLLAGVRRATAEHTVATTAAARAQERAAQALAVADESLGDESLAAVERRLREECGRLTELAGVEKELLEATTEAAAAERRRAELAPLLTAAQARRVELPALTRAASARLDAAVAAAARRPGLSAELASAQARHEAAVVADERAAELPGLATAVRTAVDRYQQATDLVQELREQRLAGMAAELAGGLDRGRPCPVCGSAEHPAPAEPSTMAVTAEHERAARDVQHVAAAERGAAERALTAAETDHDRCLERSGRVSVAEATERAAAAAAVLQEATSLAAEVGPSTAAVRALRSEAERLAALVAEAEAETAQLAERARAATRRATLIERRLTSARAGASSVADRRHDLAAAADAVAALAAAVEAERAGQAILTESLAAAEREAVTAGFADTAAAADAVRDVAALAELEATVAAYDRRQAANTQALGDPDLDGVSPTDETVDLGPPATALRMAEDRHTEAAAIARDLGRRAAEVRRLAGRLAAAEQRAAPVRQEYAEVRALADLVAGQGQNTRNMTLRAYVLASRLAEVAESASRRLREMSGGRYTFEYTGLADSRRVRAGLGLVVVDDYSGLARSTKTLSGGETFLASLALALGLADVVTAEAGGVQLDTLFIDEGFGSLDADTLEQVMTTLDELRAGGRVVGVVSHVEEMRMRIPSRLHVVKRREGSTLEQISA